MILRIDEDGVKFIETVLFDAIRDLKDYEEIRPGKEILARGFS